MEDGDSTVQSGLRDVGGEHEITRTAEGRVRRPYEQACRALLAVGSHVMPPVDVWQCLATDGQEWERFAAHWEELASDAYAAERGTRRLRRYGHFSLTRTGEISALPHDAFVQPEKSNPLYVDVNRHFEPLTDAFEAEPLLASLLRMLGRLAASLEDAQEWSVKVHPFRVLAHDGSHGQPTPEGRHRDGVTLVTSLLIGRDNATGGESTVYDRDGAELMTTTLSEPGTLLVGDDRATLHGVSPIRPLDATRPARRDVLVTTLTPC
ncbi:2OG-Fe dioxygenase family protein [Streptomyces olivaceiscleroticus]|uniref:2OG-Fe dioxygenase family protein n=1 Tax=Streptomyces olivaceiscleroticus TaxID=68245 RepID=A0ABP3JIR1_9ACTN